MPFLFCVDALCVTQKAAFVLSRQTKRGSNHDAIVFPHQGFQGLGQGPLSKRCCQKATMRSQPAESTLRTWAHHVLGTARKGPALGVSERLETVSG